MDGVERLLKVAEEVAPVLDADGYTNEAVGDAGDGEFIGGVAGVGGGFGVADEGFHAAERDGVMG